MKGVVTHWPVFYRHMSVRSNRRPIHKIICYLEFESNQI